MRKGQEQQQSQVLTPLGVWGWIHEFWTSTCLYHCNEWNEKDQKKKKFFIMYHLRLVIDNIASMVENFWTIQFLIAGWEQIQTLYKEQLSGQE